MDGRGIKDLHKGGEEMSTNSSLPSREQQETSELNGSGGGEREGDKGAKTFCPGWRHQPGLNGGLLSWLVAPTGTKGPPFCPGWCLQQRQNSLAPLSPSLSPRPSHSAHLFLTVLGSGERSSCSFLHHICEDL